MLQEKENAKEQANAKGIFLKGCTRQWTEAQTLEGGRGWVEGGGVGIGFALVQRTKINSASCRLAPLTLYVPISSVKWGNNNIYAM